jgi:hypothetical protein
VAIAIKSRNPDHTGSCRDFTVEAPSHQNFADEVVARQRGVSARVWLLRRRGRDDEQGRRNYSCVTGNHRFFESSLEFNEMGNAIIDVVSNR